MVNVLVCVKRVPEATNEVVLTPDGMAVDGRYVGYTTSPHEECAVELATQIAATGGTSTVLTLGPAESVEQLRAALAVGVDSGVLIEADADSFGPADVARAIAEVVRSRGGDAAAAYDLVLVGNDAGDTGDFQVGVRLGYALDWPVVAGISTIEIGEGTASLVSDTLEGTLVYDVALPAVVTVLEGGVAPRYPSLVGRMKAKRAPVEIVTPSFEPVGSGRISLTVPPPPPNEVRILGEGPGAAAAVVATLHYLGVTR